MLLQVSGLNKQYMRVSTAVIGQLGLTVICIMQVDFWTITCLNLMTETCYRGNVLHSQPSIQSIYICCVYSTCTKICAAHYIQKYIMIAAIQIVVYDLFCAVPGKQIMISNCFGDKCSMFSLFESLMKQLPDIFGKAVASYNVLMARTAACVTV